jgi:hypothetical protein
MRNIALLAVLALLAFPLKAQETMTSWELAYDDNSSTLFSIRSNEGGDSLDRSFSCSHNEKAVTVRTYWNEIEMETPSLFGDGEEVNGCDRTCKQVSALTYAKETADFQEREPGKVWVEKVEWKKVKPELVSQLLRDSYLDNLDKEDREAEVAKNRETLEIFEGLCVTE